MALPSRGVVGWVQAAVLGFVSLLSTLLGLEGRPLIAELSIGLLITIPLAIAFSGLNLSTSWVEVPKCVDDIRRYTLMYYFCMIYQLIEVDVRQKEIESLLTLPELHLLLHTPRARGVTCVKWVAARLAHLEALGYLAPMQLHETNESLRAMIAAFNGLVKIKSSPMPFAVRQLCSLLAVAYVYCAPLALASHFYSPQDEYWSVMLRTMLASFVLGFAILGINQAAVALEDPWHNRDSEIPLVKIGMRLNEEMLFLFAEPIPPLEHAILGSRPVGPASRGGYTKEINVTAE
ncbi:MAG: hypothetical protein SGPRY_007216 [Prymnesium sp.]